MAKELIITLVKSSIGTTQSQKDTLKALGLGKIGTSVVKVDHPSIQGMITKVAHLVEVKS